jgi:hypothetical protein
MVDTYVISYVENELIVSAMIKYWCINLDGHMNGHVYKNESENNDDRSFSYDRMLMHKSWWHDNERWSTIIIIQSISSNNDDI